MAPASWKALTSSRLASLKDYVAQKDYKGTYDALSSRVRGNRDDGSRQTWDQWARQALGKPYGSSADMQRLGLSVEKVQLFPGWAVRRYKNPSTINEEGAEFSLDVYVSGFASSLRPPEAATRSQKAFYRLAKGYAALPKLPTATAPSSDSSPGRPPYSQKFEAPSDFDLSKLPPTPADITDETDLEALEAHFRELSASSSSASSYSSDDEDDASTSKKVYTPSSSRNGETTGRPTTLRSDSYGFSRHTEPSQPRSEPPTPTSSTPRTPLSSAAIPEHVVDAAQRLHANLDARLQPFWSSAIPNRLVRLSIYCPYSGHAPSEAQDTMEGQETDPEPLAIKDITTSPQGAFQTTFSVPWERLATHPPTLHIAFGEGNIEYPVVIQAEMWAPPPISPTASSPSTPLPYSPYQRSNASRSHTHLSSTYSLSSASTSSPQLIPQDSGAPSIKNRVTVPLSLPHVPIRLISDIDDTIKHAGVLLGAKNVFQNVFVRHLDELVVHSMVDWYKALWQKGVRFHYVSNSPFELLPVLTEFFHVSSLPEGSIRLKSYAARSLLPALLSPPAVRKRQGVVEVLDAFPESRFILVGDTGEQDMELYAELARERPRQIVGVFVRNVSTEAGQDDGFMPSGAGQGYGTGSGSLNAHFGGPLVDTEPERLGSMPSMESLSSAASARTATSSNGAHYLPPPSPYGPSSYSSRSPVTPTASTPRFPGTLPRRKSSAGVTPEERRRNDLEMRIERARAEIPRHTAFRVFREPDECVEVQSIMDRLLGGKK